eukprot:scaffold44628_cov23-Tisochrysis_lutea.AAC.1
MHPCIGLSGMTGASASAVAVTNTHPYRGLSGMTGTQHTRTHTHPDSFDLPLLPYLFAPCNPGGSRPNAQPKVLDACLPLLNAP